MIELIVTISIVAFLIALLLPALGAARETARMIQCLTGQRQVGMGLAIYSVDNGAFVPYHYATTNYAASPYVSYYWSNVLAAEKILTAAGKAFSCPSYEEGVALPEPHGAGAGPNSDLRYSHYGYNYHFVGGTFFTRDAGTWSLNPVGDRTIPAKPDELARPSATYLVMDSVVNPLTAVGRVQGGYVVNSASASSLLPHVRHASGRTVINVVYADGHGVSRAIRQPLAPFNDLGTRDGSNNEWDRR